MTPDEIRDRLAALQSLDVPTHGGRTLAYAYDSGRPDVDLVAAEALVRFAGSNGLDPTAFPAIAAMEADLIGLAGELLHAPTGFAGTVTSGGTESCLLAVLAARDANPHIARPRLVAPTTVHAAFHKAAHLFGLTLHLVDVDPETFRADPSAMAAALDEDTVLVVASAPSYAHGVVDPVAQIAAAASARGIRCHVDACIGGWVLPFLDHPHPWDFQAEGVTSVSVDLHKYGYAPKGVSLLLHRSIALRHSQFFATTDWPGYGVVNPTLQSTRSGGPIAAAWATSQLLGTQGYAALAHRARTATLRLVEAIADIDGLRVVTAPDTTLVAIATDDSCDPYTIVDELLARGWYTQPQLPYRDGPATVHLSVSAATADVTDDLVRDLRVAVRAAQQAGPTPVDPAIAQVLAALDPDALDGPTMSGLLSAAGLAGASGAVALPHRMAAVHALLAQCPAPLRAALLVAVMERLG